MQVRVKNIILLSLFIVGLRGKSDGQYLIKVDFHEGLSTWVTKLAARKVTDVPHLTWYCDGGKSTKFARGCRYVLQNISTDHPNNTDSLWGIGRLDQNGTTNKYMCVGTPFNPQKGWLVWASDTVNLSAGVTYKFMSYVRNLSRLSSKRNPQISLQYVDVDHNVKTIVTPYTAFPVESNNTDWHHIEGYWTCGSSCKAQMQIYSWSPDSLMDLHGSVDDYMFGLDDISLEEMCTIKTSHTTWCENVADTFYTDVKQTDLDTIRWYVNDTLVRYHTGPPTDSTFIDTFTSPGLKNIKVIRSYAGHPRDTCMIVVKIIDAVHANFTVAKTYPYRVQFKNTSTGAQSYKWKFSDTGHPQSTLPDPIMNFAYTSPLHCKLIAYGYCGVDSTTQDITFCYDTNALRVDTTSTHELLYHFKARGSITYSGSVQYHWTFGDGTSADGTDTISHSYTHRGNFVITLVAASATCGLEIATDTAKLCAKPSSFTLSKDSICFGDSVILYSNYKHAGFYAWLLNGKLFSNAKDTSIHIYQDSVNTFALILYTGCSFDTIRENVFVYPQRMADFNYALKDSSLFLRPVNQTGTSYSWTVYNGITSVHSDTTKLPSLIALHPGQYKVCLTVTYRGCSDTSCQSICVGKDYHDCCKGCASGG